MKQIISKEKTLTIAIIPLLLILVLLIILPASIAFGSIVNVNDSNQQPPSQIVTIDASELVLAIDDFEAGWTRYKAVLITGEGLRSAYQVYFFKGTSNPVIIQNIVAVYSSMELAKKAYVNEIPVNVSIEYPSIGDECFLDVSVLESKYLVFRRDNVVAQFWLQQDIYGDIQAYAKKVEHKIDNAVLPTIVIPEVQPPTIVIPEVPPPTIVIPEVPPPTIVIPETPPPTIVIPETPPPTIVIPETPLPKINIPEQLVPSEIAPAFFWGTILIAIAILLGIPVYFLPSIIAAARHKKNTLKIFLINLLTGWSLIGWVVSFVLSLNRD